MLATLHFDGCCLPVNPGGIACWAYFLEPEGKLAIPASGLHSEKGTNNQAEYAALEHGLMRALVEKIDDISVYGDSQLVVMQVCGEWEVKSQSIAGFHHRCCILARKFRKFEIDWIPREENGDADGLAHGEYLRHAEARSREAAGKVDVSSIRAMAEGIFEVAGREKYVVDLAARTCTCHDYVWKNRSHLLKRSDLVVGCKHLFAVEAKLGISAVSAQGPHARSMGELW